MQKKILASLLFILHTTLLQADNVLRIAVSQNVGVLNPQGYNTNQMYAQNMIYEGLVKTDKKGNIIPSLAVSWHIKDSGKTYIFQLRENVKFANGELFDAKAVKKNFDSILKNRLRHSWVALSMLIDSVEIQDSNHIILHLKQPYIATLQELSLIRPFRFIAPSMIPDDLDLIQHNPIMPIGTGPYMLTHTQLGISDTFTKNPDYWDKESYNGIYFDKIITKVIIDPNAKLMALKTKQVDMIYGYDEIPIEIFKDIAKTKQFHTYTSPHIFTTTLVLNANIAPLNTDSMRKALALGINKKQLVKAVYYDYQNVADLLFSPNMPYANLVNYNPPTYNKEEAKNLIKHLGYVLQDDNFFYKDNKRLEFNLNFIGNNPAQKAMAEILQVQLKEIGIFLKLIANEETIYRNKQLNGSFDICFSQTWGIPYEPLTMLHSMLHVGHVDYVVQKNLTQKPQLDKAIQEIIRDPRFATLSSTTTHQIQTQITTILTTLYNTHIYIPLTYQTNKAITTTNIGGITMGLQAFEIPFWEFYRQ